MLFPLEINWSLITGYNNTVRKLLFSGPLQQPARPTFQPQERTISWHLLSLFFHTFSPSSLSLFCPFTSEEIVEKGKRKLDAIWHVLIAVWTPVSLRKLNWPAVMSPYSKLSDLLHLTLIRQDPDWALHCRQASSPPLTSGSVGSYSSDAEPFEMYASEDRGRDAVFEMQVITVAERADREELLAVMFLLFPSLVFTQLHLGVQCSATEIPPLPARVLSSHKHGCQPSRQPLLLIFRPTLPLSTLHWCFTSLFF